MMTGDNNGHSRDLSAHRVGKGSALPNKLKSNIESFSGISLNDVQVYYNSMKPVSIQALSCVAGSDIHLAPGQEKHLAHEVCHVVQQRGGRVQSGKGQIERQVAVAELSGDASLTAEADVMGSSAMQM